MRTDPQRVSRVHIEVKWKLITKFLCGSDYVCVDRKWLVGDSDVDRAARAMLLSVDLSADVMAIYRLNKTFTLETQCEHSVALS